MGFEPVTSDRNSHDTAGGGLPAVTARQWRAGIAAWLGWMFDGLDMHLYTLVAAPVVAELLGGLATTDPRVGRYGSVIQAAFLVGWAAGGALFGRVADRLGRARALCLTILTYAGFTGLSFFAHTWWQLLLFRFLAALGIGGEWAVGASLLAETWPRRWRPWLAAVLQSCGNVGVLLAGLTNHLLASAPPRSVFLVGVLPALLVFWIRRAVPEPEEWRAARATTGRAVPMAELFRGETRAVTLRVLAVCALGLTAHWAFLFWHQQQLRNLPEVLAWTPAERARLASTALYLIIGASIPGNFLCAWLARHIGYRTVIGAAFLGYFLALGAAYAVPREPMQLLAWFPIIGLCQGVFALFAMYLPPLFPTLLRASGAGFCFNIGRLAAAAGTVFFGSFSQVGDHRLALLYASLLLLPAAVMALRLPPARD